MTKLKQQRFRRPAAGHRASESTSAARPRYSLDELLKGMRKGDMPRADGWDDLPPVGREAGANGASASTASAGVHQGSPPD